MTPQQFFEWMIKTWEGGYQDDLSDHANVTPQGKLLGTMRGITPATWARWVNKNVEDLTVRDMKAITVEDAAKIGMARYYSIPDWDKLLWVPSTAFMVDWGWHSGPTFTKKRLQNVLMVADDGILGPMTRAAYAEWLDQYTEAEAIQALIADRMNFFRKLVERRPINRRYLNGWNNRAQSFAPGGEFWQKWHESD